MLNLLNIIFFSIIPFIYSNEHFKPKIAIIGGGIGGTATAYFLRELFEENVTLHLYEPNEIGGRLATTIIGDREFETGGSIIHSENKYMKAFIRKFGLKERKVCPGNIMGLFNGQEYPFVESTWELVTIAKLFYHYGLDAYWISRENSAMLKAFSSIYQIQNEGQSFDSVEDLLYSMSPSFPSYLKHSLRQHLKDSGLHKRTIDELVTAITMTNYGQSPDGIHAFVGSVAISGAGSSLWAINKGNKKVPEVLLENSEAVRFKSRVSSISPLNDHKFKIISTNSDREESSSTEIYDAVSIATPLTKDISSLSLVNFTKEFSFKGHYEKIICSLVEGELNANGLKFKDLGVDMEDILVINKSLGFNSIGKLSPVDVNEGVDCKEDSLSVYKVFSPQRLTKEQLEMLFSKHSLVDVTEWFAYPHYDSSQTLGKFTLLPGLYYNNAIEMAASAMEMSTIAARNVALLIFKHLGGDIEEYLAKDEL